ncbi:MAG: gliding motility-associated C-terminal domain-containing protein [Saprospiraceae bacterium]|nr:gliding motility-associated C-terminal domain-containing protein [Saprospiraceae bacterium]
MFFSVVKLNGQTPFVCKGQYFLSLTPPNSASSGLYEVKIDKNTLNVVFDPVSNGVGVRLNAMGYRSTDNFIYGMDPQTAVLSRVGQEGIAEVLGVPQGIPLGGRLYFAGDVTPDGKFLILMGVTTSNLEIVKVDLDDPNYRVSIVPLQNRTTAIFDIAFDPFSGELYGHDSRSRRLVRINHETGAIDSNFPVQTQVDQLGALFFDSFGNLYGYGAFGSLEQDKFVAINKRTGEIRLIRQGPNSVGQDGCSCPYTLQLQKIVSSEVALPCTEVVYSFVITNASGAERDGIRLFDQMPPGFIIKQVSNNPFGGTVNFTNNSLTISDMIVKVGQDTINVVVEIGSDSRGLYRNQAVLSGLPVQLGGFTLSDNPRTIVEGDSTDIFIEDFDLSYIKESYQLCRGDSILIDALQYGIRYEWYDGDTSPRKWLKTPGNYTLRARSLCEELFLNIEITESLLDVNIIPDLFEVELGDEIYLESTFFSPESPIKFKWTDFSLTTLECDTCQNTTAIPLNDFTYTLTVINDDGCLATDQVTVRVKKVRNVFSPNIMKINSTTGNDVFYLSGNQKISKGNTLKIFDRWGNNVFTSNNFQLNDKSAGWNGYFKGAPVVEGVYAWICELEYIDGFIQIESGDLTILR